MTTPKKPTDHEVADHYAFTVKGKRYLLPKVTEDMAADVPAKYTFDALMSPDDQATQVRLALANLNHDKVPAAVRDALLSLSTKDMMEHVGNWLGESSASSD